MRADLIPIAQTWLGTPWCANSAAKGPGGGVACHCLPRAILVEAGWLPADFPEVRGTPNTVRLPDGASLIEQWLDGRPEFVREPQVFERREFLPQGCFIGLQIRRCVDHLGLCLGNGLFIHVLQHKNVCIDRENDPAWSRRRRAVWAPRPLH